MQSESQSTETETHESKKILEGIAVAFGLLTGGLLLQFIPNFLGNETITLIVSICLFLLAIVGFSNEISKTIDKSYDFTSNVVIGGIIIIGSFSLHYYFSKWWVNLISLMLFMVGIYGLVLGIMQLSAYLFNKNRTSQGVSKVIFLIISQILTLLSAVVAIIQALGIKINIFS
ncbi:hypothetical protein [Bacillus paranthracis]|uniref:hypothetical protein n=1 Tax=Bacillus paranthracis TaxID=2026186 RepID=UPI001F5B40E1|nr:hypothetical protein [Bacillus paranthracis]